MPTTGVDFDLDLDPVVRAEIDTIARPYLWWDSPSGAHSTARCVAQIMNLGIYDDILRLEAILPRATLISVMSHAQPGWLSPRSWEFWRGRLRADLPGGPPTRIFPEAS